MVRNLVVVVKSSVERLDLANTARMSWNETRHGMRKFKLGRHRRIPRFDSLEERSLLSVSGLDSTLSPAQGPLEVAYHTTSEPGFWHGTGESTSSPHQLDSNIEEVVERSGQTVPFRDSGFKPLFMSRDLGLGWSASPIHQPMRGGNASGRPGHSLMPETFAQPGASPLLSGASKIVLRDLIFENRIPTKLEPSQVGIGRDNPSEILVRMQDLGFRAPRRGDALFSLLRMGRPDFEPQWSGLPIASLGQPGVSSSLLSLLAVAGDAGRAGSGPNAIPPGARERIQQFLTEVLATQLIATTDLGALDRGSPPRSVGSDDAQPTWDEPGLAQPTSEATMELGQAAIARTRAGRPATEATHSDRVASARFPDVAPSDWNVVIDPRAAAADDVLSTRGADLITQFDLTSFSTIESAFARVLEQFDRPGAEIEEPLDGFAAAAWITAALIVVEFARRWYQQNHDRKASRPTRSGTVPLGRSSGSALVTLVGWLAGKSTGLP